MLSPGILIAMDVTILYLVMGPLVLYALYVAFDSLGQTKEPDVTPRNPLAKKDPVIWSDKDINL